MKTKNHVLDSILKDMISAIQLPTYEAVDVYWVALVKIAHLMPGESEHKRLLNLLDELPIVCLESILHDAGVDALLDLDPPLESILVNRNERLSFEATQAAINSIRDNRIENPRAAIVSLGEILKRIRNKRAHGFKTRDGPRDEIILKSARSILQRFCEVCVEELYSH